MRTKSGGVLKKRKTALGCAPKKTFCRAKQPASGGGNRLPPPVPSPLPVLWGGGKRGGAFHGSCQPVLHHPLPGGGLQTGGKRLSQNCFCLESRRWAENQSGGRAQKRNKRTLSHVCWRGWFRGETLLGGSPKRGFLPKRPALPFQRQCAMGLGWLERWFPPLVPNWCHECP